MESEKAFLGRGWSFPPEFIKPAKGVNMLEEVKDIESSLEILLSTRVGERFLVPAYGCNLDHMIFETIDLTLTTYFKDLIETAILYYEPRIDLEKVEIDTTRQYEGMVLIILTYTVRTTNSRFNYVYPYYKNEGTNINKNS